LEEVRFVRESTALLSMRDSDFDAYSAYGEVLDNSIQADANTIAVRVDFKDATDNGRKSRGGVVTEIAFGDNGTGMDSEVLHQCMQLGYSSRYNDRSGIGRFGVGMTLAAINQCKRVEIYSKEAENDWFWTYMDLDKITSDPPGMESIPKPVKTDVPMKYQNLVGKKSGTIVIWSKYDRPATGANALIDEMRIWFGRTYRRFIWEDDLNILLNNEQVKAFDPLYVNTEKTKFPDDEAAYEYTPMEIPWTVPLIEKPENAPDESIIKIRMSLIDESLRLKQHAGGGPAAKARCIDRNEGISILRNRREVFYGIIPRFGREMKDIDRWWGGEISFDAVLDRAFTVKNIKRGAVPVYDLKRAIYDQMKPTMDSANRIVSDFWKDSKAKKDQQERDNNSLGVVTGHEAAEAVAAKTPTDKSSIDKHKTPEQTKNEAEKIATEVRKDGDQQKRDALAAKFASQPFTIIDENWRGPDFFETNHLGGKDVIRYNLEHPFFQEIYKNIDQNSVGGSQSASNQKLGELVDLLIISYSKSEAKFERDQSMTAEDFIEFLRVNWGQYLKSYLNTWKRDNPEDENNS
jgi:hypothetical protein